MTVKPIPDGYGSAIPYLIVRGAAAAIDFYKDVYGATEMMRFPAPDGRIGHAELKIGEALFMIADEHPELGHRDPRDVGGTPVSVMVYVPDVDALSKKAQKHGAKVRRPLADQFYGDRSCTLEDPFGHVWHFATHKEDLSLEEMNRRMKAMRERETA
jgi:PhnB protein